MSCCYLSFPTDGQLKKPCTEKWFSCIVTTLVYPNGLQLDSWVGYTNMAAMSFVVLISGDGVKIINRRPFTWNTLLNPFMHDFSLVLFLFFFSSLVSSPVVIWCCRTTVRMEGLRRCYNMQLLPQFCQVTSCPTNRILNDSLQSRSLETFSWLQALC